MIPFSKSVVAAAMACGLLFGCTETPSGPAGGDCLSRQPRDLKGLAVSGARSRGNVVHELWKVICRMRAYQRAEKPHVQGTLKASLVVDFNGEMGRVEVVETDIEDRAFVGKMVALIASAEFSFWGQEHEDTGIVYTFVYEPSP